MSAPLTDRDASYNEAKEAVAEARKKLNSALTMLWLVKPNNVRIRTHVSGEKVDGPPKISISVRSQTKEEL